MLRPQIQTEVIPREKHFFTVSEANRALPLVRRIVRDVTVVYRHVLALRDQMDHARMMGQRNRFDELEDALAEDIDRLRGFAAELREIGVVLKDWHMGLVDFPAVHHGREVLLCWRQGEDEVRFWHEISEGFAGRQSVEILDQHSR